MTPVEEALRVARDKVAGLIAGACSSLAQSRPWSDFDLAESLGDTWKLSEREDCCYDRPSIGLNYALWYHARRTQDMLRLALRSWESRPPAEILDLGSGTGATAWALAFAIDAGLPVNRTRIWALDGSPPMLNAAEHMWSWLCDQPSMSESTGRVDVQFSCRSWTQPGVVADGPDIVAGFLFDDSDQNRLPEVTEAFRRVAEHYAAPRIHAISSHNKRHLLAQAAARLADAEWRDTGDNRLGELWTGAVDGLRDIRTNVLSSVPTALSWDMTAPSFSHERERPCYVTLRREAPVGHLDLRASGAFVLDERQAAAAEPDHRMTIVVGPAGSGKSRVAVERIARLFEQERTRPLNVLVTAFNIQLIDQLARWLDERDVARLSRSHTSAGDVRYTDEALPNQRRLRFLNWDKVPSRLLGVRTTGLDEAPFDDVLLKRVDHLEQANSWELTDAARRNLAPAFLQAELRRVIWGLRVASKSAYTEVQRTGRRRPLSQEHRECVWDVLMGPGHPVLFDHIRMRALRAEPRETFSHVVIDECQDFTPADFELAARLLDDARGLWTFGDKVQALQLGPAYERPRRLTGRDGQRREWTARFELPATYRLPLRIAEAIGPLADEILKRDRPFYGDDDEPLDSVGLQAVTSAVLGMRPILIAGKQKDVLGQIGEVLTTYRRLFDLVESNNRIVTLAEGDPWLTQSRLASVTPTGITARRETMRAIKGLERPAVVWSTRSVLDGNESLDEWIYTILSRTTGLLIILLSHDMSPDATNAVRRLRRDRLLPWTSAAATHLQQLHEVEPESAAE